MQNPYNFSSGLELVRKGEMHLYYCTNGFIFQRSREIDEILLKIACRVKT